MNTLTLKKRDAQTGEVLSDADNLRRVMRECAEQLFTAIELKIGVMDSESKAQAIGTQRVDIMQAVAERLREA